MTMTVMENENDCEDSPLMKQYAVPITDDELLVASGVELASASSDLNEDPTGVVDHTTMIEQDPKSSTTTMTDMNNNVEE
eukprot:scaffold49861_cov85-Attheya_sp.AAC.2